MIFYRIVFRNLVAWVGLLLTWVTFSVSISNATSLAENRLAAELVVMKGDLRRMSEFSGLPLIQKGLKDRLLGASAPLSLLIRKARENNSLLPLPPENSVVGLQRALVDEKFSEATFWVNELLGVFPFETKNIFPTNKTKGSRIKAEALHDEFCSGCHASKENDFDDTDIERPAWNLFQMAKEVGEKELAARLLIGVKGDTLTAMDNPLSYNEISRLIGLYRKGLKIKNNLSNGS